MAIRNRNLGKQKLYRNNGKKIAIYKKDNQTEFEIYRVICLLNTTFKTYNKIEEVG